MRWKWTGLDKRRGVNTGYLWIYTWTRQYVQTDSALVSAVCSDIIAFFSFLDQILHENNLSLGLNELKSQLLLCVIEKTSILIIWGNLNNFYHLTVLSCCDDKYFEIPLHNQCLQLNYRATLRWTRIKQKYKESDDLELTITDLKGAT